MNAEGVRKCWVAVEVLRVDAEELTREVNVVGVAGVGGVTCLVFCWVVDVTGEETECKLPLLP